jgi:hypothetical protein
LRTRLLEGLLRVIAFLEFAFFEHLIFNSLDHRNEVRRKGVEIPRYSVAKGRNLAVLWL